MKKKQRITYGTLFAAVFLAEFGFGYDMAVIRDYMNVDAISRVANAFYVLFSRDPHLGAIGFIWNPLPSFLEIFILLLNPLIPVLSSHGLAGVLLTSLFAGGTAVLLFAAFTHAGMSVRTAILVVAAYALNPFVFLYGSNGMSETLFSFFLILLIVCLIQWFETPRIQYLIAIGMSLAMAFLVRYEAVLFGAGVALVVSLYVLNKYKKNRMPRLSGVLVVILTPPVFAGLSWLFANQTIMGDALFFYKSTYSNLNQTTDIGSNAVLGALIGHPLRALGFIFRQGYCFMLPALAIFYYRLRAKTLFRFASWALLILLVCIPALQFYMFLKGSSNGFLRFNYYYLPILTAWFVFEYRQFPSSALRARLTGVFLAALLCSAVLTGFIMNNPKLAPEEYVYFHLQGSDAKKSLMLQKEIAAYLDRMLLAEPDSAILLDVFNGNSIVLRSKHPHNLVVTSDLDFKDHLSYPEGKVDYILVPKPEGMARLNAVNTQYPGLFQEGAAWVKLVKDFDGQWRLYRVETESAS